MRIKKRWIVLGLLTLAVFVILRESEPNVPKGSYLVIDLEGAYAELPPGRDALDRLLDDRPAFLDLLATLRKARHDKRIDGVLLRVQNTELGWAQAQEIRASLAGLRDAGKKVVSLLDSGSFGSNREYFIASAADELYLPPGSSAMLNGMAAHFVFLGGVWEKIDIDMEVEQIREYKSMGDMIGRRGMSAAHREAADFLLDDLYGQFGVSIALSRGLEPGELPAVVDACPASPEAFMDSGLADGVRHMDQLRENPADGPSPPLVYEEDYRRVSASSLGLGGGERVAVIHAAGNIVNGESRAGGATGASVGADTLARAFDEALADGVKAIVLRVDSPGGSAQASDQVWRLVRAASRTTPVVASLGNIAGSGGYYMASGADRVLAQGMSITGSIGVVLFKPNVAGLLGRLGIGSETLTRGRYAGLMDISKGFDRAELSLVRTQMERTYQLFLRRVARGRSLSINDVDSVGGGRVWSGQQALERGLVDEIGGFEQAVAAAATAATIEDIDAVELVYYPRREKLGERLSRLRGSVVSTVKLPPLLGRVTELVEPAAALRPGVQLLAPALPVIN